jgi:hypothetical protein
LHLICQMLVRCSPVVNAWCNDEKKLSIPTWLQIVQQWHDRDRITSVYSMPVLSLGMVPDIGTNRYQHDWAPNQTTDPFCANGLFYLSLHVRGCGEKNERTINNRAKTVGILVDLVVEEAQLCLRYCWLTWHEMHAKTEWDKWLRCSFYLSSLFSFLISIG